MQPKYVIFDALSESLIGFKFEWVQHGETGDKP